MKQKLLLCSLLLLTAWASRAQTALDITLLANQTVQLAWPAGAGGATLESSAALGAAANWQPVAGAPTLVNGRNTLQVAGGAIARFFRLRNSSSILTTIAKISPENGEADVSVNRETVMEFSSPLATNASINGNDFYAEFGGRRLLSRVELSSDRRKATLFALEPIPPGARIAVRFVGDKVLDAHGQAVDADGDGTPGGVRTIQFDTFSATGLAGTAVIGHVYASEPVATGNGFTNHPLPGVLITVDGAEDRLRAVTDNDGFFHLSPCPSGRFFVHIDGRPAFGSDWPAGAYYPYVGKTFEAVPGRTNNLAGGTGEIFLPLINAGTLKAVSVTQPTTVTFPPATLAQNPALAGVSVTVPANSLFADDGTRGGLVGIAPVAPDRIPSPLPPGLKFPIVITVQTDGPSNFDTPVPVRFPNLPDPVTGTKLPPGAKSALWSYDHDQGRWEIQGSMTVTADGEFVETDPGVGIRQPGWHGSNPGSTGGGGGGNGGPCDAEQQALEDAILGCAIGAALELAELAPAIGCGISLASALASTINACGDPQSNCAASAAYNAFFGVAGCIPGVGTFTGIMQCGIELGSALGDLAACQSIHSSVGGGHGGGLQLQAGKHAGLDVMDLQEQLSNSAGTLLTSVLGDALWLDASARDSSNTVVFANALIAALDPASASSTRISSAERTSLLALPAPNNLSSNVRAALLDRFDRFAAGGVTAAETNAIQAAANALTANTTSAQNLGWTTMFDGFKQTWQSVVTSFDAAAGGNSSALQSVNSIAQQTLSAQVGPPHLRELLFRVVDQTTGFTRYGRTDAQGNIPQLILAADGEFILTYLDPLTLEVGSVYFKSGPAGNQFRLPRAHLTPVNGRDSDQDGLTDLMESIVGTRSDTPDTDNDGVTDFVEVQQGQNPLDGLALPQGVVANLLLGGSAGGGRALGLHVEGTRAFVANGRRGLAIADVTDPLQPAWIGEIDLPGESFDVTYSPAHQVVGLVASAENFIPGERGLLHFVDASDPFSLRLRQSYSIPTVDMDTWNGLFFVALGQFAAKEVRIYDPGSALEVGSFATQDYPTGLRVTGGRAYVATLSGLEIFDVTQTTPTRLGRLAGDFSVELLGQAHLVLDGTTLFVSKAKGATTIDVSNPAAPKFLGRSVANAPAVRSLALNGGGQMLALTLGTPAGNPQAAAFCSVYDVSDPAVLNSFQFSLTTPGRARDLAILNGFALVADDQAGLTVLNFAGADVNRQAPVITFDPAALDVDAAKTGWQAREGGTLELAPRVEDDVQLDRVELLVNGQLIETQRTYPVNFKYTLPALAAAGAINNFVLQFRAVDRSGNAASSSAFSLELTRDSQPPVLLTSVPAANGAAFVGQPFVFEYSEPVDGSPLPHGQVRLLYFGADNASGGGDDVEIAFASSTIRGAILNLNPPPQLTAGKYQLSLPAGVVKDRAGNALAQASVFVFNLVNAHPGSGIWISDADGQFDDPTKWLYGRVPTQDNDALLARFGAKPTVTIDSFAIVKNLTVASPISIVDRGSLSVLRDCVASEPVDVAGGTFLLSGAGSFEKQLSIAGGQVEVSDKLEVKDKLALSKGGSLTFNGASAKLLSPGGLTGASFTVLAKGGAVIDLSGLTTYDDPGDLTVFFPVGSAFVSLGTGSRLTLPDLTAVNGPVAWNVRGVPSIKFEASDGGVLQLPKLATASGRTQFTSSGFNSVLNAPVLAGITGPVSEFIAAIDVSGPSEVQVPALTLLTRGQVTLQDGGVLRGVALELAEGSSLKGVGTVAANLVNRGSILLDRAPGNLIIAGKLTLQPASVIDVTIGLGAQRAEAGRLEARGEVRLDGTLKVSLGRGYVPVAGQQFETANFTTPTLGTLAQINDTALGNSLKAELETLPTKWNLKISSRP